MIKVIVVSDSHGLIEPLQKIIDQFPDVDYFIHCGDSELNSDHSLFETYKGVKGNCDRGDFPDYTIIEVGNKKILVTHGHLQGVRFSLNNLNYFAEEYNADIVCYGHTHIPYLYQDNDITIVNPGSIKHNRGLFKRIPECFALIEISDNGVNVKHLDCKTFEEVKINKK